MDQQTVKNWRILSRALRVIGATGCIVTFGFSMFLIIYYSYKRPGTPLPANGWTFGIPWTHPTTYGTARDVNRLLSWSWWFFPSFGIGLLSEAIKMYVLNDFSGVRVKKLPYS
jgi:hypothetical protein